MALFPLIFVVFASLLLCFFASLLLCFATLLWLAGRRAVGYALTQAVAEGAVAGAARAHPNHSVVSTLVFVAQASARHTPHHDASRGRMGWVRRASHRFAARPVVRSALGAPLPHTPLSRLSLAGWVLAPIEPRVRSTEQTGKKSEKLFEGFSPSSFRSPFVSTGETHPARLRRKVTKQPSKT
jgi:hypothetical protein